MIVIPAIDLKDGQCVRLRQGEMSASTVFSNDPLAMAQRWVDAGAKRLHLVDLNGAFAGKPVNGDAVRAIAEAFPQLPIQIGGGIRTQATVDAYLDAGVSFVIIGTQAVKDPPFVHAMCQRYPGKVIVGIDAKSGWVATQGWADVSSVRATDLARQFAAAGVAALVYTDIARDGMMAGVNVAATVEIATAAAIPVIASGGVTTLQDIKDLHQTSHHGIIGAITGRAIYEGSLDLAAAQAWCDAQ